MSLEEKGRKMYNSLREFYPQHERMEFLEFVIKYAEIEAEQLGLEFDDLIAFRGYTMVEDLYNRNIECLNRGGEGPVPLEILTEGEIRWDIEQKYAGILK